MATRTSKKQSRVVRLMTTPLSLLLRGQIPGRRTANDLIESAAFPELVSSLIRNVVRRTKLWPREKLDVAEELIAHFSDGLEAGHTPADLVDSFGDASQAAKLIRRAKSRNRPWWWHMQRRCRLALLILFGVYVLMGLWLMMGKPAISVDYVAKLNQRVSRSDLADRAWPVYREAWLNIGYQPGDLDKDSFAVRVSSIYGEMREGNDVRWSEAVELIRENQVFLQEIRRGADYKVLGLRLHTWILDYDKRDRQLFFSESEVKAATTIIAGDPDGVIQLANWEPMVSVRMDYLPIMKWMIYVLCLDMRLAAEEGDGARIVADYRAILGISRQCREHQLIICDLFAQAFACWGLEVVGDILLKHRSSLSDGDLLRLAHLSVVIDDYGSPDYATERLMVLDYMQRIYGKHGQLTVDGVHLRKQIEADTVYASVTETGYRSGELWGDLQVGVTLPIANLVMADRDQMLEEYDRLVALGRDHVSKPLWELLKNAPSFDQMLSVRMRPLREQLRYGMVLSWVPAFSYGGRMAKSTIALRDALQVAIAIELHCREHDSYPDSLDVLTPRYFPNQPIDHSTGRPLLYKILDGRPLLYGRGHDGDDDGGVPIDRQQQEPWPTIVMGVDGDWVLWPKPANVGTGSTH